MLNFKKSLGVLALVGVTVAFGLTTTSEAATTYYPACSRSQTSIANALKSIGVDNSYTNRKQIAILNGISNYTGTASQNTQLLNLLKNGSLIKSKTTSSNIVQQSQNYSTANAINNSYYSRYTGSSSSIVTALNALGVDSSYANRKLIATRNGISNYTGTASQNNQLLSLLKNGRLLRPSGSTASTSTSVVVKKGDVNGDGVINSTDLTILKQYLVGSNVSINKTNADINGDGKITTTDASQLSSMLNPVSTTDPLQKLIVDAKNGETSFVVTNSQAVEIGKKSKTSFYSSVNVPRGSIYENSSFNKPLNSSWVDVGELVYVMNEKGNAKRIMFPNNDGKWRLGWVRSNAFDKPVFVSAQYIWPTPNNTIVNTLYYYNTATVSGKHMHSTRWGYDHAMDISAPVGVEIKAPFSGTISNYSQSNGFGTYIILTAADGEQALFAHLSKSLYNNGSKVDQGTVIAKSGNSGNSGGPHIHFELKNKNLWKYYRDRVNFKYWTSTKSAYEKHFINKNGCNLSNCPKTQAIKTVFEEAINWISNHSKFN